MVITLHGLWKSETVLKSWEWSQGSPSQTEVNLNAFSVSHGSRATGLVLCAIYFGQKTLLTCNFLKKYAKYWVSDVTERLPPALSSRWLTVDVCIAVRCTQGCLAVRSSFCYLFVDEDTLAKHTLILVEMQWKSLNIITSSPFIPAASTLDG